MLHPSDDLHPRRTGESACKAFARIDLANLARFASGNGLEVGEARSSERFLSERWNWSRGKVRRFLDDLADREWLERIETADPQAPNKVKITRYEELFRPRGAAHEKPTKRTTSRP